MIDLSNFKVIKLTQETPVQGFCCDDDDLNHFLIEDAKNYTNDLMAVTYLYIDKANEHIAAYFTLLNDKVAYDPQSKGIWNRINRHISNSKRRRSYPSAKIGRLAVATEYAHKGLGAQILDFVKTYMLTDPKLGCRFLTVDAYAQATSFYQKNGFDFFTSLDVLDQTRLMYFDLKPFKDNI